MDYYKKCVFLNQKDTIVKNDKLSSIKEMYNDKRVWIKSS